MTVSYRIDALALSFPMVTRECLHKEQRDPPQRVFPVSTLKSENDLGRLMSLGMWYLNQMRLPG